MSARYAVVLVATVVCGCAATTDRGSVASRQAAASMTAICVAPQQCVAMWTAARSWVLNTCGYPLEKNNSNVIETYNTAINTVPRQVSDSLACRVSRAPRPEGGYVLTVTASCSEISPPANPCYPPVNEAMGEFNRSVSVVAARFNP